MGSVCVGGLYDGRPANAVEDQIACREGEGRVAPSNTTGCSAIRIAPIGFGPPGVPQNSSLLTELVVLPIRLVRNSLQGSPVVAAIEALNDDLLADLERITPAHSGLANDLTKILLDAAYFAGSMLQGETDGSEGGGSVFTSGFYERIVDVSHELEPHLSNPLHRHAIRAAVDELKKVVGKNAGEVYAILRKQTSKTAQRGKPRRTPA
jgi:hypothetical protein